MARVPIVGAMKGHAIGAGKTVLVATDYRCAASGRVLVGMPEIKLGVPNPYFAEQLLRFLVADSAASALIYSGEMITAEQAMTIGLVDSIHEKSEVEVAAMARARTMASLPRIAFRHSKNQRTHLLRKNIESDLAPMIELLLDSWFGEEAQSLLRAAAERLRR